MGWTSIATLILIGPIQPTPRTTKRCLPKGRFCARSWKRLWPRRWSNPMRAPRSLPAARVTLVDKGILRNFEMSRLPLTGFPHSNGHGRRQIGAQPVSRQGNLIVQSSLTVSNAELRKKLVEEIKRQGKQFGLLIDDIAGGFTFTGRGQPQAFQVQPLVVYKVFANGKPDELVRGVDIVGTPLVSLTKILATGDTPEIFNGYCGAESGSVPVAAVAPAILISEMEVQKKETSTDKPPILPPPAHDEGALR